jgi:D-aminopeptidase
VRWTLDQSGNDSVRSVNALVGETNDGGLNDIRGQHVRPQHVFDALKAANTGAVQEGSVGAGTGTQAFGWKGGIGTSSRKLDARYGGYTVGVLVQSNYGGVLTMGGAPVGKILGRYSYQPRPSGQDDHGDGSCMVVVATDAPLDARDLKRLAARAMFGLARTGSSYSNGSGDFAIAFSTAADLRTRFGSSTVQPRTLLPTDGVSPLFQAALEATEEAVYNSLLKATPVSSRFGKAEALPIDRVKEILGRYPKP